MTEGRVAVVGVGHVGSAVGRIFGDSAVLYDKYNPEHSATKTDVNQCRVAFVCVPTPEATDGGADLSEIEDVFSWLRVQIAVIRSTVPPGTTDRLMHQHDISIVFWPEYYGEWSHFIPWNHTIEGWPALLLGGRRNDTRRILPLLASRFGAQRVYRQAPAIEIELSKYMENAWLAMQVTFAHEFERLAQALGVDYWDLRESWALDPRVSKTHTVVGVGERGFGGRCLPKDLRALLHTAEAAGCETPLLRAVDKINTAASPIDITNPS